MNRKKSLNSQRWFDVYHTNCLIFRRFLSSVYICALIKLQCTTLFERSTRKNKITTIKRTESFYHQKHIVSLMLIVLGDLFRLRSKRVDRLFWFEMIRRLRRKAHSTRAMCTPHSPLKYVNVLKYISILPLAVWLSCISTTHNTIIISSSFLLLVLWLCLFFQRFFVR